MAGSIGQQAAGRRKFGRRAHRIGVDPVKEPRLREGLGRREVTPRFPARLQQAGNGECANESSNDATSVSGVAPVCDRQLVEPAVLSGLACFSIRTRWGYRVPPRAAVDNRRRFFRAARRSAGPRVWRWRRARCTTARARPSRYLPAAGSRGPHRASRSARPRTADSG